MISAEEGCRSAERLSSIMRHVHDALVQGDDVDALCDYAQFASNV